MPARSLGWGNKCRDPALRLPGSTLNPALVHDESAFMSRPVCIAATVSAVACVALLKLTVAAPAKAADDGQAAFNNHCRTCHSTKKGDNRLGPSLYGIFGRKAGTVPGYSNYSQSLAGSGITWTESTLDKYIEDPEALIPNNNMKPYTGSRDPAERQKIITYLKSIREGS
jgi:cytochrome c